MSIDGEFECVLCCIITPVNANGLCSITGNKYFRNIGVITESRIGPKLVLEGVWVAADQTQLKKGVCCFQIYYAGSLYF